MGSRNTTSRSWNFGGSSHSSASISAKVVVSAMFEFSMAASNDGNSTSV